MNTNDLKETLKQVGQFTAGKSTKVVMYRDFCFREGFVSAYNGSVGIVARVPLELDCTVPASRLLDFTNTLPKDEDVTLRMQEGSLHVSCGRSKGKFDTRSSESFPNLLSGNYSVVCESETICDVLDTCLKLTDDLPRNSFRGIYIHGWYVYSTDGLRSTRVQLDAPCEGAPLYLPMTSAKLLRSLGKPRQMITFSGMAGCLYTGRMLASTLLNQKFPQSGIDTLLTDAPDKQFVVDFPETLLSALSRATVFCGPDSDGVEIKGNNGELSVSSTSRNAGSGEEHCEWSCEHQFVFRANPLHFADALRFSLRADISQVVIGQAGHIRFIREGADHVMALMQ